MRMMLDRESDQPLYRQICQFFIQQIEAGKLLPSVPLPATRELAQALCVSRITVIRAYDELESLDYVIRRQGIGTFVSPRFCGVAHDSMEAENADNWPVWQQEIAYKKRASLVSAYSALEKSLHPHPISFIRGRIGLNEGSLFSLVKFRSHLLQLLRNQGEEILLSGLFEDISHQNPDLIQTIAEILTRQGIPTAKDEIIITSGAQQAISLVFRCLLRPGDIVMTEMPTYNMVLDLLRSLDVYVVGVPVDEHGMQVELCEDLFKNRQPRLIFSMPTFHNPTGVCLSLPRRKQLVDLASRYSVPILEDDYAGDIRFEGEPLPALKTLDHSGNVIFVSTFSKILGHGFRLGYLVARGPILNALRDAKILNDISTSTLLQRLVNELTSVGFYQMQLKKLIREYRVRRDAMDRALHKYMPEGSNWSLPAGGFFIWLRLPNSLSAEKVLPYAVQRGVNFIPGSFFFHNCHHQPYLRLNFIVNEPHLIDEGINRLAAAIQDALRPPENIQ